MNAETLATALLESLDHGGRTSLPSDADPAFDVDAAYALADLVMRKRLARGERRAGWKIGFTNRGIWDRYGVQAPIWGPVWDTTLEGLDPTTLDATVSLARLAQPRLEPEVMFRFARAPEPGMDERALAGCIAWVAHGFEIVQTHYEGWRFTLPDTVADFALHGRLFVGPPIPITAFADPARELAALTVELREGERSVETGHASIVLDGPLTALRIWVDAVTAREPRWPIAAGDIVTTGTVTDAAPLMPGQCWSTRTSDPRLPGVTLRTAA